MSSKATVVVRRVEKRYELSGSGSNYSLFKSKRASVVNALQGVSFVANTGESIGVVGRNGSGKSTLFRLIAGSEAPTRGNIHVSSTPTLLGVSSALQGNLTGDQNIQLGLLAMGLSPNEARSMKGEVAAWADLSNAIGRPLKTYSSGMRARLVFAISTAVRREILLVDEALSTGDKAFARKAKERMNSFLENTGTVFIVSHGEGTIQEYCSRAIWLHDGRVIMDADAVETSKAYVRWSKLHSRDKTERANRYLEECRAAYVEPRILFEHEVSKFLN